MATSGGCQCGALRYVLHGPMARAYACHCRDCQKQSASAFSLSIPIVRSALRLTGAAGSFDKASDSGGVTTCWFCPTCGSRLFHTSSRARDMATLKAGSLDDAATIMPVAHLWVSRKQAWIRLDPEAEQFETQPDDLARWRAGLFRPR